jgi:hypothetical protein
LKECDEDRSDVTQKYDSMAILLTFVLFLCWLLFAIFCFVISSRLSCQITLTPELDGLTVLIPTYPEEDVIWKKLFCSFVFNEKNSVKIVAWIIRPWHKCIFIHQHSGMDGETMNQLTCNRWIVDTAAM